MKTMFATAKLSMLLLLLLLLNPPIYAAAKKLQANGSYGYGEPATDWRPTRRHGFD